MAWEPAEVRTKGGSRVARAGLSSQTAGVWAGRLHYPRAGAMVAPSPRGGRSITRGAAWPWPCSEQRPSLLGPALPQGEEIPYFIFSDEQAGQLEAK